MTDKESPQKKVTTEEIIQRHVYYIVSTRSHVALIKTCWYLIGHLPFSWGWAWWLLVAQLLFIFRTLFVLWHSANS